MARFLLLVAALFSVVSAFVAPKHSESPSSILQMAKSDAPASDETPKAEEASSLPSKVLVVGAGAIGLRTALELCQRNVPVVLRAPHHPLKESCSVGAGGFWMPFRCDDPRVDRWATETLHELLAFAEHKKRHEGENLVEVVAAIKLLRENTSPSLEESIAMGDKNPNSGSKFPTWTHDPRLKFQHLSIGMQSWQNSVHKLKIPPQTELQAAGYQSAWFWQTPIVNTHAMLRYFIHELIHVHEMDVELETGQFYQTLDDLRAEARALNCDVVVNCAGLGSRELVPDPDLVPARGVLLHYDRATCARRAPVVPENQQYDVVTTCEEPHHYDRATCARRAPVVSENKQYDVVMTCEEPPWGSKTHPAYMIPRDSILVVGGTYLEGDTEPNVRESERQRILQTAHRFGIDTARSQPCGEWVGFRPFRSPTRCEFENASSAAIPIFHSYGHGGSGWTVNVGAAKECFDQILKQG